MRTQNNAQAANTTHNSNNNNNESINQNLKCSGNEMKSSSPLKRYANGGNNSNVGANITVANNQTNSLSPFHTNDYLNYGDVRRASEVAIGVR